MGNPVSLRGHAHVCPAVDPGPKPHVGGPVVSVGQSFVTVDGIPIAGPALLGTPCSAEGLTVTAPEGATLTCGPGGDDTVPGGLVWHG